MNIYWLRNDLRLHDNIVLNHAIDESVRTQNPLLIIFCGQNSFQRSSNYRKLFIQQSLSNFGNSLSSKGSVFFTHYCITSILQVLELLGFKINKLFFSQEYTFDEVCEEKSLSAYLDQKGIEYFSRWQSPLIDEEDLPFSVAEMPFVFTNFRKKIELFLKINEPVALSSNIEHLQMVQVAVLSELISGGKLQCVDESFKLTELQNCEAGLFGGESAGLKRLKYYLWDTHRALTYKETRNGLMDFDDSTKFSVWLNAGCLSPRKIMSELKFFEESVQKNDSTYWIFFELLWRDYFKYFSRKYGAHLFQLQGIPEAIGGNPSVNFNQEKFLLWCDGRTGVDFIDANMCELNQTGWMSNRGRQNVASFLIHQMKLPWIWGAAYFESKLIDYDPDLNWGNWLYLSGRGSDPRAREFNVARQVQMYDPDLNYQTKWLKQK